MYRPKFILINEAAGDGADNGGGTSLITPSKWGIPDGAEDFSPAPDNDDDDAAAQVAAALETGAAALRLAQGHGN